MSTSFSERLLLLLHSLNDAGDSCCGIGIYDFSFCFVSAQTHVCSLYLKS